MQHSKIVDDTKIGGKAGSEEDIKILQTDINIGEKNEPKFGRWSLMWISVRLFWQKK